MSQFPLVLDPSNALGLLVVPQVTSTSGSHLPSVMFTAAQWYPQTWNSVPHPRLNRYFSTGWVEHSKYIPHEHLDEHAMSFTRRDRPFKLTILGLLHPDTTPPPRPGRRLIPLPSTHDEDLASSSGIFPSPSPAEDPIQSVLWLVNDCVSATEDTLSVCSLTLQSNQTLFHHFLVALCLLPRPMFACRIPNSRRGIL
jgi:hypothetical protein